MYFLICKPKALKRRSQITPKTHTDVLPLLKKKISRKVGTDALLRARLPPFFSKSLRAIRRISNFVRLFRSDGLKVDSSVGPFDPDELDPDGGSEFRKSSGIGAFSHEHGSFDPVRYAYVIGEFRGPDDDRIEFVSDFLLHEAGGFESFDFAFERFGPAFRLGIAFRPHRQDFNVMALSVRTEFSAERLFDDPVDLEVGIPPYRRGEVRVILERESEMPEGIFAVAGFRKPGKEAFFDGGDSGFCLHARIRLAEFFRRKISVGKIDPVFLEQNSQIGAVFFRRGFVYPVNERNAELRERARYFLVGQNHERFDEPVRSFAFAQGDGDRFPVRSEFHVRFGDSEIDAAFGVPSDVDDSGEFEGFVHEPKDFSVGERMLSVPIFPGLDFVVGAFPSRIDLRFGNPHADNLSLSVDFHKNRQAEFFSAGMERTKSVRETFRKHRNDAVGQVGARSSPERLAVEGGVFPDVFRDVGDMHAEFEPSAYFFNGNRVVKIFGIGAVDGDDGFRRKVFAIRRRVVRFGEAFGLRERFGIEFQGKSAFSDENFALGIEIVGVAEALDHFS